MMLEIKSIKINDITVSERIRPIDENQAQVLALSIATVGLITPVTVRATPNAKDGKFTLVAGAHRLRACVINKLEEIDAVVIKGDQTTSKLMEVTENLIRNDLSVIDRAAHVRVLRDLYEEENGKINPKGGRPKNRGNLPQFFDGGFSQYVADRLGLSGDAIKRLNRISQNLAPQLREKLRYTPLADNQAALLKFAKMEQGDQQRMAHALNETNGDTKKALNIIENKLSLEKPDPQDAYLSRMIELLEKLDADHRAKFDQYYADLSIESRAA